jgi:ubiquinone/menaquinone biosynthesis C-methylase UbiE
MKLNVGCSDVQGEFRNRDVWINIDKSPFDCKNFERADPLEGLTYPDGYFEEIFCIHVLEHIERADHAAFLKELYRVTKPGGLIYIEVPDFIQICKYIVEINEKISSFDLTHMDEYVERQRCWILSVYGKGRWAGDAHRWGFTADSLWKTIEDARFKNLELIPAGPHTDYHKDKMISSHYKQEPVMLVKGVK